MLRSKDPSSDSSSRFIKFLVSMPKELSCRQPEVWLPGEAACAPKTQGEEHAPCTNMPTVPTERKACNLPGAWPRHAAAQCVPASLASPISLVFELRPLVLARLSAGVASSS